MQFRQKHSGISGGVNLKKLIVFFIVLLLIPVSFASGFWDIPNLFVKAGNFLYPRGNEGINASNFSSDRYLNSSGALNWIRPENIFDVDLENICRPGEVCPFVLITGDNMTGNLQIDGDNNFSVNNSVFFVDGTNDRVGVGGNLILNDNDLIDVNDINGSDINVKDSVEFEGDKDIHYGAAEINNNLTAEADLNQGDTSNLLLFKKFANGTHFVFEVFQNLEFYFKSINAIFSGNVTVLGTLTGGSHIRVSGINVTSGTVILGDFETSAMGGANVVRRSNANGALFGISNPIAGANANSGAGYVTIQDCGNYTIDAHSSLDTNNPNGVVHHLRGCMVTEVWRLNPNNSSSSFEFERGLHDPILKINTSVVEITGANLTLPDVTNRTTTGSYLCINDVGVIYRKNTGCDT